MALVKVFLADGFEEIEGLTVVDLLRRAEIEVSMVSITDRIEIVGAHNIVIKADEIFNESDFANTKMLVLPGGMPGTKNLMEHEELRALLNRFYAEDKMIAAICAAPSVLGLNNILVGKKATCYPGFEDKLVGAIYEDSKVVKDNNIITSKGLGTAIEFALSIIRHFKGKEVADKIEKSIIY